MCKKLFLILVVFLTVFMFSGCNNGSCTVTKSYGTNSFTKDAANTCVKKLAGATCYKNSSQEDIANIVAGLQKYYTSAASVTLTAHEICHNKHFARVVCHKT